MKQPSHLMATLLLGASLFGVSHPLITYAQQAANAPLTAAEMQEISPLMHKGNLTTGFFDCMVAHQKSKPEEKCLPAELKFQTSVLDTVVNQYTQQLAKPEQIAFQQVQTAFENYRSKRCNWYNNAKVINNPKKRSEDPELVKMTCYLESNMTRRLELDALIPENDESN